MENEWMWGMWLVSIIGMWLLCVHVLHSGEKQIFFFGRSWFRDSRIPTFQAIYSYIYYKIIYVCVDPANIID